MKARLLAGFFILGCLLLEGCAGFAPQTFALKEQRPPDLPLRAEIPDVPFFPQQDYYCGPAALAMALNAAGAKVTVDAMVEQVYLPGRKGSLQVEMLGAARRQGMVAYVLEPELAHLLREVAAGTPVVVLQNFGVRWFPGWHYAVVVGYDLPRDEIIQHSGEDARDRLPLAAFEYLWKTDDRWAMVAMPPNRVPVTATEQRYGVAVAALEKAGQTRNARRAYEAMLERWPSSLIGLLGRGNTAHALGDLDAAEASFRLATLAHPDAVAAYNNLAQTLMDRGKLDEARPVAERAVQLGGPLSASAQATLHEILKRQRARELVR